MKFRTTENSHLFTRRLFSEINAYSLEGLTMDANRNFTAAVEAVEFEADEQIVLSDIFNYNQLNARYILANNLNIPFYIIVEKNEVFKVYQITKNNTNNNLRYNLLHQLDITGFANWWSTIKGTNQTYPLVNGADLRTRNTIFDSVLEHTGQAWGGNIDGYIIENDNVVAIIDNISIGFKPITDNQADPARFFHKRGPKYATWLSTVKLANELECPHFLFTVDKNNENNEVLGITNIKSLDNRGIYYVDNITPPQNIINGIDAIISEINNRLQENTYPTYE